MGDDRLESDSQQDCGGYVPGSADVPAYRVFGPCPTILPVMIAVPHAGRCYPSALLRNLRSPEATALKLEDRYVDKLAHAVARDTGVSLLVAQAPRAMIDLNRAPEDVDWEMFSRSGAGPRRPQEGTLPSRRARSGLGLIPRRLPGLGELWRRPHDERELKERIEAVHRPYHERLAGMLAELRDRWGCALLIDLHSMPPLASRTNQPAPEFVLGDRFGAASHGSLVAAAFAHFAAADRVVAHNRPYAGGYVLERHARPQHGLHALQIEIDRSRYLDPRLKEPGPGFDATVAVLSTLVRALAAAVAELGRPGGYRHDIGDWPMAAE